MLNIVLVHPEIPNNTGNIGRLCLGSGSALHLVKPFGFEIDDSRLRRAGLDYWQHLDVQTYESIEEFFDQHKGKKMALLSKNGHQEYWDIPFEDDMFLIFGKESSGLESEILELFPGQIYRIPLFSDKVRSLNLANAVGIVAYEGLRQLNIADKQ